MDLRWTNSILSGIIYKPLSSLGNYISLDPPRVWDTQVLPKEGFKKIWHVWADYRALRLKRGEIGELTDSSKYIISILRWYETEVISNKSQVNE
jgi:hypothetical protein